MLEGQLQGASFLEGYFCQVSSNVLIVIYKSLIGHTMSKKNFIRRDTKSRTFFHCLLNAQLRSSAHELDEVMDDNCRPAVKEQIRKIWKIPKT